jgi:predicted ATP-dependent serine protease
MLVWGLPGHGKSTFCMKLANEIANTYNILYVSGEEKLNSSTLKDKQKRTISEENKKACTFINRLPVSLEEWKRVLIDKTETEYYIKHKAIFYDSVTKLDITPFYVGAVANECKIPFFNKELSHIFISHAHKDGSVYRGDGSWGHEVDIVIRCEKGIATTEKNRFGEVGKQLRIY